MKLYICIPHYIITPYVAELAKNAINSFKKTADCTIINCDDCSPYDTSFLKELPDIYIRNKENKGFAGNCNVGFKWIMEHEKEDAYVVCANNDIEVYEGWFEEFVHTLEAFEGDAVGGLGFKVKIVEGKPIEEYKTNPGSKYNASFLSEGGRLNDWVFPGGFYMTKISVLRELGLYDEGFEHGGYEDIDLFLRWKKAGKRLLMTPKVPYWHEEGATRFSEQERGTQNNVEPKNRQYFKEKWGFDAQLEINNKLVDNRINL